jgi:23S rRNA pseudouridine1911/1915/1917 synthase
MENKIIIEEKDIGKRLDQFLQEKLKEFSRSHIQNAISKGEIFLIRNNKILKNNEKSLKNGEKLKKNDIISYFFEKPKEINLKPENLSLDIIYEDSDLAIINKPQGLVVHPCVSCPEKTLVNGLLYQIKDLSGINGEIRPGIVHRIDKDTCGLLLIAKNDKAHVELSKQIANKTCSRKYLALIKGSFKNDSGMIETLIGRDKKDRKRMAVVKEDGRIAITEYKTVEKFRDYSLVEFSLKTGRTHQIRVHAKHLNHPIVGDIVYGGIDKFGLKGQFLCAYKIEFIHPTTKEKKIFQIELPENFKKIINDLK